MNNYFMYLKKYLLSQKDKSNSDTYLYNSSKWSFYYYSLYL